MNPFLRAVTALLLGVVFCLTPDISARAQSNALDARIVILDASGSMKRNDYPSSEGSRWKEAMALAEEYFEQLQDRGDTVPTEVMIFGAETSFIQTLNAEQRKPASNRRFTSSKNYPINGPLCDDIRFITSGFEIPERNTFKKIRNYMSGLPSGEPKGGMTPQGIAFNMAFERLIKQYGPGLNAQVVAFSDFEDLNCAPRNQTICDQIVPNLNILQDNGGRAEMRILEIPSSDLVTDLLNCTPSKTVAHDPGGSTPEETITKFLDDVTVSASVRSTTPGLLNPSSFDLTGLTFRAFKSGRPSIIAGGPAHQSLVIEPGEYDFVLSMGSKEWRVTKDVQTDQKIQFSVEAGRVTLTATRNGNMMTSLGAVQILDKLGRNFAPNGVNGLPAEFVLMAGTYEISAQDSGQTRKLPVAVSFANTSPTNLAFDNVVVAQRPVVVEVDVRQPTVDVIPFTPLVQLSGGSIASLNLSSPSSSLNLAPGKYNVDVGGARIHKLDFEVPVGTGQVRISVVVTPGRFAAQAPNTGGSFELHDASGQPIASFTGDTVRHSIADGTYTLVFVTADGGRIEKEMQITAGDLTTVDF